MLSHKPISTEIPISVTNYLKNTFGLFKNEEKHKEKGKESVKAQKSSSNEKLLKELHPELSAEFKSKNRVKHSPVAPVKSRQTTNPQNAVVAKKITILKTQLKDLDLNELCLLIDSCTKENGEPNHILQLKSMSYFLNENLINELDPTFNGESLDFPNSALPSELTTILDSQLKKTGRVMVEYFFESSLVVLVNDLLQGKSSLGHKLLLQYIARKFPTICSSNQAKHSLLKQSCENNPSVCLSLLWCLGQGGYKDLNVGLTTWQNIMLPLINVPHYTKFICNYLGCILKANDWQQKINMAHHEFQDLILDVFNNYNIQLNYKDILCENGFELLDRFIEGASNLTNIFYMLFCQLSKTHNTKRQIIECLIYDDDCFKIWRMHYNKELNQSLSILMELDCSWENLSAELKESKMLRVFLRDATKLNKIMESASEYKDFRLEELQNVINSLSTKASQKDGKSSSGAKCGCWLKGIFLLFAIITGVIVYDYSSSGSVFRQSKTGQLLAQTGTLPYVETAWVKSMSTGARGYIWAEANFPGYYERTMTVVRPYGKFSKDLGVAVWKNAKNVWVTVKDVVNQKTPAVVKFMDQYAPGLALKIQDASVNVWRVVSSFIVQLYHNATEFFSTKVFVGNFSPENLGKALNRTQVAFGQYYTRLHKQIDIYAKIK